MKVEEIIQIASDAYPDELVMKQHLDPQTSERDTLALFIARELVDIHDAELDDAEQLLAAVGAMETARNELTGVVDALLDRYHDIILRDEK